MITPILEKLILSGKASYNTHVIGGAEKCILGVDNDRFIIITDLTYFSQLNLPTDDSNLGISDLLLGKLMDNLNTQLKIFSKKSNNTFLFRNNIMCSIKTVGFNNIFPIGSVKLDTYLIHDDDVSFTFSKNGSNLSILDAISPSRSIGSSPPFDYGLDGQPGALNVRVISGTGTFANVPSGKFNLSNNSPESLELMFNVDASTQLTNLSEPVSYPILNVGYVEILGNPTNIGATL